MSAREVHRDSASPPEQSPFSESLYKLTQSSRVIIRVAGMADAQPLRDNSAQIINRLLHASDKSLLTGATVASDKEGHSIFVDASLWTPHRPIDALSIVVAGTADALRASMLPAEVMEGRMSSRLPNMPIHDAWASMPDVSGFIPELLEQASEQSMEDELQALFSRK